MEDRVYLTDRAGHIHVWKEGTPNYTDPWERAICGDPGDFNRILDPGNYFKDNTDHITCPACRKKLGIPTQAPLF